MSLKVFISYTREDQEQALHYYDLLKREGVSPWLDVKHLLPGQNWEAEINRAFLDANIVVLLLSPRSVSKRGFVQREANDAIERLRYKQVTDIYVMPLLLEPCEVPTQIAGRLQYVDLTVDGAWDQVRAALCVASEQQSVKLERGVSHGPFIAFTERIQEKWDGQPGYETEIDYPRFVSSSHSTIACELSNVFLGRAYRTLLTQRQAPWHQLPELFADCNPDRTRNGRWEGYGVVHATDRMLSLTYEVGWYGAGAAHPNMYFETFNFACLDKLYQLELGDFFRDSEAALDRISKICIQNLSREYWKRTGECPDDDQVDWFQKGAGNDSNNFGAFTVSADHFTFLFAPYQVSSYAMGRWATNVSFYDLLDLLKPDGPHIFAIADCPK